MSKARKTVNIEFVKEKINYFLKNDKTSTDNAQAERGGAMMLAEILLMETHNYRGFRYLDETEVPFGEKPGIHSGDTLTHKEKFANTDSTRIQFS